MPDFRQQNHLARNAPADQRQTDQHESHEVDRMVPIGENQDQPQHECQRTHRQHESRPFAFLGHRVAAAGLAGDAGDQRDERRADAGDSEHHAPGDDVCRKRSAHIEQDAPDPGDGGDCRDDEDQQRRLGAGESGRVDREGVVGGVFGNQAEACRRGRRRGHAGRDQSQSADDVSGDQRAGPVRGDDECAADERQHGERVADRREEVLRRRRVGPDDLADDRCGGAVERDADGPEVEDDGTGRQARRVASGGKDIGSVSEAEGGHCERNGAEKDAYTVIHRLDCFPDTLQIPHQQNFSYLWGRNDPFTSRKVLRSCARFCVAPHSTF